MQSEYKDGADFIDSSYLLGKWGASFEGLAAMFGYEQLAGGIFLCVRWIIGSNLR